MKLTDQQAMAFAYPCFEPDECAHGRYYRWIKVGSRTVTLAITANIGFE